jgi:subtilisin family serine protease
VNDKKVKIAILDTGVDLRHEAFEPNSVKNWKSFLDNNTAMEDSYGHGTFTAALVHKIAPNAELFIARVCLDNILDEHGAKRVAEVSAIL